MSPKRAAAIVLRQFYLLRGSPVRLLPLFAWVAIDIVVWGLITRYLNSVASAGFNFVPALLGAVLLWDFLVRVMQGLTTAFFEDVWSRNFLNIFATPLAIPEYVSGLVLSSIATSGLGLVVMLVLATSLFGLSFFVYGVMLIPFSAGAFSVCGSAGHLRLRARTQTRAGGGVAHLADPRHPFAVRVRLLSALGSACVDAIPRAPAAAVVCFRSHADDRPRRNAFGSYRPRKRRPCALLHSGGGLVFHAHLQTRRAHRTDRALQRREPVLTT